MDVQTLLPNNQGPAAMETCVKRILIMALALAAVTGCSAMPSRPAASATLHGDAAHPAATMGWLRTELYFGIGNVDTPGDGISDERWQTFLDTEVSSRFPDGLSVIDVYGQWRGSGESAPRRLRSRLLVLLHPDNADVRARIEAIRSTWKDQTGHQSVLRVTQTADVSF